MHRYLFRPCNLDTCPCLFGDRIYVYLCIFCCIHPARFFVFDFFFVLDSFFCGFEFLFLAFNFFLFLLGACSVITVATDGSGQFTAISPALSYAQNSGIPTVSVKAGTYTDSIIVQATAAVTVVGESSSSSDYSQNKVVVSNAGIPLSWNTAASLGTTWKNINFVTSNTASTAAAASLSGSKNAFYDCQFISAGDLGISSSIGTSFVYNSYIEARSKLIYNTPNMYIYGSTLTPTASNALLVYNKGVSSGTVVTTNSTVVFDSCAVTSKSGTTVTGVSLAAANGIGSVVVYRNSALPSFILGAGVHVDAKTQATGNFYGEFGNTGAGSYSSNSAARASYVKSLSVDQASQFSVDQVFATSNTNWIDSSVISIIQDSDASQVAKASTASVVSSTASSSAITSSVFISSSSVSTSSSSVTASSISMSASSSSSVSSGSSTSASASDASSLSTSATPVSSVSGTSSNSTASTSTTVSSSSITGTSSALSTGSTSSSESASVDTASSTTAASTSASGCSLPSSVPTTARVVGPAGSCANYTSIADAVKDLSTDQSKTEYVYILAGTYAEQITFSRVGPTVFRGETSSELDQSSNKVTLRSSAGVLSSSGGSSATAPFQATQYYSKSISFYNINFENAYTAATGYNAVALSSKALKAYYYNCGITSSQGALLLNYGAHYFSGCKITGTTDIVWGQGGAYIYNSKIVSTGTTTGQSLAAQSYQSQYNPSQFVFDTCTFVPTDSTVPKASTYLGRDYTASARVAVINSYLDAHIAPVGWLIASKTTNVTFVEASNSGPGASTASRVSQIVTDASAYSASNVLGALSIDTAAVAPVAAFPDSVYASALLSSSSSVISSYSTPVANSTTATAVSASASSTSATAAATATNTLIVSTTPAAGEYGNVTAAIAALPNDSKEYTIYIRAGTYQEQFSITRNGKVTLRGETTFPNDFSQNQVTIQFSYGVLTSAGQNELTPVINAKKNDGSGLALYNINFVNTYPQTKNTAALAADFYGANMAAYGCKFVGYQDTLLANKGTQVFSNSYIEGSIDYIWGFSTAYFHQCYIASNTAGGYISAMSRASASATGGYVFDSCYVTYTSTYGSTFGTSYLGRPYSSYSIAVYMNSFIDKHISPAGWAVWQTSNPQTDNVLFGEFNNTGPGSWSSSRASFATNLTESQAAAYKLSAWVGSTSWLDMDAYNYVPSYDVSGAAASTTTPSASASSTIASATAAATWAHPSSGATPPTGAVLVSVGGSVNGSYSNLTAALAALPSDSSTQIIFMYPGTYNEQPPAVDRPGPVQIIGAQDGNPGQSYRTNKVILTQARGLSVSPLPTGHSDAETATFSTASNKIAMYNIDIINSDNLDGSLSSYVTLAGSIYGSRIAFYGCSFIGWQDTLLTGSSTGYHYYESCYIDGAIDFIWGYSKAYFKGCTIGAKRQKSAITAHSRASSSAVGGYIFDQCLFTAASSATVDLTQSVYLGRPYSKYALVVVKNSYLDNVIQPAGWKVWSATDPRTDAITFAEFNNTGPGNWENNAAARTAFGYCTLLTSDTYSLSAVMDSPSDWIDMTYWDSITTPTVAASTTGNTTTTVNGTSVYDGTTPPAGALIVSKTAIDGVTTYDTIQSALNALPTSSSKTGTIFIYPGVYSEQLVLSKSGTTVFIGYSAATDDYSQNQVTVDFNKGIDTQADASNSDSATVYATGNYFQAYNINFKNSFGTAEDYASLGFGVKSSKYASLYGCQVWGNQDSLLINGYFFAFKSLIVGNIDMIWGSGAGYFLNSTISPNTDDVSLTASKRATNATAAGFVFDQCTVKPAPGTGPFTEISLGRPWNNLARVAYIETYLDSSVEAAGWSQWSKSTPQTDGVTFAEYGNYGPGAGTSKRASFSTQLSAADAAQFQLASFFAVTSWINFTRIDVQPFVASEVVVPTSVASSSVIASSTLISSSTLIPSTVFVTKVTTDKETLFTTITAAISTVTSTQTVTLDMGATVTPDPVYKTSTVKGTTTIVETLSQADVTQTSTVVVTSDIGTTVTPEPSTVTTVLKQTTTVLVTSTEARETITVKSTVTSTSLATKTLDPVTSTISLGSTVYVTSVSTPKAAQVTSTRTITSGTGGTSTKTTKATTTYVTVTSVKTTTKKSTTTLSCVPTDSLQRRSYPLGPRAAAAAGSVTTTTIFSTLTTYVKTSTATSGAVSTATSLAYVTKTIGSTTTLKPTTLTTTSTASPATKLSTLTARASTALLTTTSTKLAGKPTTLKPSTLTVTSLAAGATRTSTTTVPAAGGGPLTTTSFATVTLKSTTTAPASTVVKTSSKGVTSTVVQTLAQSTSTAWKTATLTLAPSVTVVRQSTVVKTTTAKATSTVVSVVTRTAKGAGACTAGV
ncbi:pectinesterase family protein [Diplodia corticola]|uniref:pectinesterase n=1 Tax=Diplodia corticola TaxID=236234 RepID=A0A1J9RPD3_9PEZI|nr:pectinesterase family protein [Diplodia corticola]OJD29429.1 pectinesterase family protein [Diplodia corticola]